MGFLKVFGLEKEKNEIGSYKYDRALEILEDLDLFCLEKASTTFTQVDNIFDLENIIKIGKYEIGGTSLYDFFRDLRIEARDFSYPTNETNKMHIFWIRNSETDEIKTYSKFDSNGVRIFYDTEKDELFTYDENGKDNLYVGLQNVKHYYARNYSTIDGFKFLDDDIETPLSEYKLNEIFSCNFKELQATGTWSNQNEFNTLKKDQEKYDKIKEKNNGKDIFSDFLNTSQIATWYDDVFKKYGVTHVIIGSNSKLSMLISKNPLYNKIYNDKNFVIYERVMNE